MWKHHWCGEYISNTCCPHEWYESHIAKNVSNLFVAFVTEFFLVLSFQASLPGCAETQAFLCMESVWERSLQWAVLSALAVSPAICWRVHQRELAWPMGRGSAPNPSVMVRNTYKYLQCFFFPLWQTWMDRRDPIFNKETHTHHLYSRITLLRKCVNVLGRRLRPIVRLWFQEDKYGF